MIDSAQIKQILKAIGIPALIVTIVVVVAIGFYIFRQYQDSKIASLTIKQMRRDLN